MRYTKIVLPYKIKNSILAVGAQSKGVFCFVKGNTAYLSDSGGDLSDLENFKKFERDIKRLQRKLKIKPMIIACDLHPEYVSTKYALRTTNDDRRESRAVRQAHGASNGAERSRSTKPRGERRPKGVPSEAEGRTTKIQHHEAHIASCMTDNNIKGKVIGIAFDGTGFGLDGNIWGGEFFVGDIKGLKRASHLKYIPMPGGEASIKEPWRMAFSYLYAIYGKSAIPEILTRLDKKKIDILSQMIDKKINSPLTSSMGRLFDGVSALIGICAFAGYEGEAAIELEKMILEHGAWSTEHRKYKFGYFNEAGVVIIDWEPVIRSVVKDLKRGVKKPEISVKFHNSICDMIKEACNLLRKRYKIGKVCMSGGVFQNKYLSGRIKPILEKEGFNIYVHKNIPTHDGGIALGQAVLANL
ncbi:MAG: hypothetical protein AUJ70_02765 [Candidatus Omnitrophica bacterium CG1_02_40_15]|nr:MAG: hypothetical protein AUJ70_02765 [Candidatus Omnitrophica bacterium CG1_02_40_15]